MATNGTSCPGDSFLVSGAGERTNALWSKEWGRDPQSTSGAWPSGRQVVPSGHHKVLREGEALRILETLGLTVLILGHRGTGLAHASGAVSPPSALPLVQLPFQALMYHRVA